jgi:probable HAF family extracellular repeat protein
MHKRAFLPILSLGVLALSACHDTTAPVSEETGLTPAFSQTTTTTGITFVDLGFISGGSYSLAEEINNEGEVVGRARTSSGDRRPFLWTKHHGMMDLGLPPGHAWGWATSINEEGSIVGRGAAPGGFIEAWYRDGDGHFTVFESPAGWAHRWPTSMNDKGAVVGVARNESWARQSWLWTEKDGTTELGPFVGSENGVREVNNRGQVTGWISEGGVMKSYVLTQSGHMTYPLPGTNPDHWGSRAWSMNDRGLVQGYSWGPSGYNAWLWSRHAGMMDLEVLPGDDQGWAADINSNGDIAGVSFLGNDCYLPDNTCQAVVWPFGSGPVNLGMPEGWTWSEAWAINDKGQIVGNAVDADGVSHAVMWILDDGG